MYNLESGARLYPQQELDWSKWSLQELLENCGVAPLDVDGLANSDEYVNKLAGWINRINEIRAHLRCSACSEIMRPNMEYARRLAAYDVTVFSCQQGDGHDNDIYLNHCWGCEAQVIDSRECKARVKGYYLCRRCGSGPRANAYAYYRQGHICPNCANIGMLGTGRAYTCPKCSHSIYLPPEHNWTGIPNAEERKLHLQELFTA